MKWDDYGEFIKIEDYVQHQFEVSTEMKLAEKENEVNEELSNLNMNTESMVYFLVSLIIQLKIYV